MKTNENKTLEQLKAELEQAQQAFDTAKKLAEQKEKDLIAEKRLQGLPTSQIRKFQKAV